MSFNPRLINNIAPAGIAGQRVYYVDGGLRSRGRDRKTGTTL